MSKTSHEALMEKLDLPADSKHSEPSDTCAICQQRIKRGL